jgi:hypothetical protein
MKKHSLLILFTFLLTLSNSFSKTSTQRNVASDEITETDLSKDFINLRSQWLAVKTGDEMEALLKKSILNNAGYSDDVKYFLTQTRMLLPLRGIVWRARPVFENKQNLLRSKSAQVLAVQVVRAALISYRMYIPIEQSDAVTEFLTLPSTEMRQSDQFKTMEEIQNFMIAELLPLMKESIAQLEVIAQKSDRNFIWDNRLAYGKSEIDGDLSRYIVHGPAEVQSSLAKLYQLTSNALVFCAFNENYAVRLLNDLNLHFAMDSSFLISKGKKLGMTDEERAIAIRKATDQYNYVELRAVGSGLMKEAYSYLKKYVSAVEKAIQLHGGTSYPVILKNGDKFTMDIDLMKSLVEGPTDVQDPVSGLNIKLNLPAFYLNPPKSLEQLMATKFDQSKLEVEIKTKNGEIIKARNYLQGRALVWNNEIWKKYVPSAEGQGPAYAQETRRVFSAAKDLSILFMLPEIMVH